MGIPSQLRRELDELEAVMKKRGVKFLPEVPEGVKAVTSMYYHQRQGVRILRQNKVHGVFDVMGTGKTLQLIYACLQLIHDQEIDCVLLVTKRNHARTWWSANERDDTQFAQHTRGVKVYSVCGMPLAERAEPWPLDRHFYMVNYELLSRLLIPQKKRTSKSVQLGRFGWAEGPDIDNVVRLLDKRCTAIVCDESHYIKSVGANVTKVMLGLSHIQEERWGRRARRYIATGTPVAEKPDDAWAQIYFLDHGKLLGRNWWQFILRYAVMYTQGRRQWIVRYKNLDELRTKIKAISYRRTIDDCADLPEQVLQKQLLSPSAQQKLLLQEKRNNLIAALKAMSTPNRPIQLNLFGGKECNISKAVVELMQAAAMPCTVDDDCIRSAKLDDLLDLLDSTGTDRVMVWCVHRSVAESVAAVLRKASIPAAYHHGGLGHKERNDTIDAFYKGKLRVLVSTMDSLRESENRLANIPYAYYMQYGFSLTNWRQSKGRHRRLDTKCTVIIHAPLLAGSMDSFEFTKLQTKERNSERSVDKASPDKVEPKRLLQYLKEMR